MVAQVVLQNAYVLLKLRPKHPHLTEDCVHASLHRAMLYSHLPQGACCSYPNDRSDLKHGAAKAKSSVPGSIRRSRTIDAPAQSIEQFLGDHEGRAMNGNGGITVVRDSNRPRPLALFQSAATPEPSRPIRATTGAKPTGGQASPLQSNEPCHSGQSTKARRTAGLKSGAAVNSRSRLQTLAGLSSAGRPAPTGFLRQWIDRRQTCSATP